MARPYQKIMLFLMLFSLASPLAAFSRPSGTLVVGVVSGKPQKRLQHYTPLAEYLASRLGRFGIRAGSVVVAKDTETMMSYIRKGEVDIVLDSAFSTLMMETAGMDPALLAWRKGVRSYHTIFVVRKDGPIRKLADLKEKKIAFEDRHSTSAFAIPVVELKNSGLEVGPSEESGKSGDRVSYLFAGEALNEAYWVLEGKVHAAAMSNNDWDELPRKVKSELSILHKTSPILRFIVSIHRNISSEVRQELERIFVKMSSHQAGAAILYEISEIRKIERLSADDIRSLEYVRTLLPVLDRNEKEHK